MTNKQRLTLMTKAEKKAADWDGFIDFDIPREAITKRLKKEGTHRFDLRRILPLIRNQVVQVRAFKKKETSALEPKQIVQQAKDTARVIEELITRLEHI